MRVALFLGILTTVTVRLSGQIVPNPQYLFEKVQWSDNPHDLMWKAGIIWDSRSDNSVSQFKTGLSDIFELRGRIPFEDKELLVLCEFFRSDSSLGAIMINMGHIGLFSGPNADSLFFDEDMMDLMWKENVNRFGEPTRSKWIPFLARSREWALDSVTVRMARIYNPFAAFVLSYFRQPKNVE